MAKLTEFDKGYNKGLDDAIAAVDTYRVKVDPKAEDADVRETFNKLVDKFQESIRFNKKVISISNEKKQ